MSSYNSWVKCDRKFWCIHTRCDIVKRIKKIFCLVKRTWFEAFIYICMCIYLVPVDGFCAAHTYIYFLCGKQVRFTAKKSCVLIRKTKYFRNCVRLWYFSTHAYGVSAYTRLSIVIVRQKFQFTFETTSGAWWMFYFKLT